MERFDPQADPEKVRACHEIYQAGAPLDFPDGPVDSLPVFTGWLAMGWDNAPREAWLAADEPGGEWVGYCLLELPETENTHIGFLMMSVPPKRRRSGVGRALLRHAAQRARLAGRTELSLDSRVGSPGTEFAVAVGARAGLTEVLRVLELADLSADRLAGLRGQAQRAAGGYSVLSWTDPCPEEYVARFAVASNALADAPHSPGREHDQVDASRLRLTEQRAALQGVHRYTLVARHDATGDFAGVTQFNVDPLNPVWGFQELTAVTREHRGHRLGMLVKASMLELLAEAEPRLERIVTGNAGSNQHMIAINAELGFHVFSEWTNWQLDVDHVLDGQPAQLSGQAR